jgi:uncharacterized protein (TIGR02453 family)
MKNTLKFLTKLDENNNREWFQANKKEYEGSHQEMLAFAEAVHGEISNHDLIEPFSKRSLFRIYRDVRFGKDKTPYKTNWGGYLKRATSELRGGYYYQVGIKESFVIGGFLGPKPQDLLHIRNQLAQDGKAFRDIINAKRFKNFFGELRGAQLKTAPRGFDKQHPEVELLRYKQFMLRHEFSDKEVLSEDFPTIVSKSFWEMRPLLDHMSEILTTDLNGESLL